MLVACAKRSAGPVPDEANANRAVSSENSNPEPGGMFVVEGAGSFSDNIEVGKYRIEAKQGNTLFIVGVQFTERAKSLPMEEVKQLKISELAKNMGEILGRLVGPGDLQYRMADGALVYLAQFFH
jgi:hypothetical protein